jgi:predicted ATPase/DNA-binding winged helix-turn-helix (wHTH) protein
MTMAVVERAGRGQLCAKIMRRRNAVPEVAKPALKGVLAEPTTTPAIQVTARAKSHGAEVGPGSSVHNRISHIAGNEISHRTGTPIERHFLFGPYRLAAVQRLLMEGDRPVRLGSRAMDILIALIERPGELISKQELMARVWPDTFVEPANLTVHVAALRRALGDGREGNRYLINIPGRGYRFVAAVTVDCKPMDSSTRSPPAKHPHNLPACLTRLIGREEIVKTLTEKLSLNRLLTVVGPGGIGKTSLGLTVAEESIPRYKHGVWLLDLAPLANPQLVPRTLASVLEIDYGSEDPLPAVIAKIKGMQMLLVLDNCEHVIEAAAALTVAVLNGAADVQVLATSREPLRIDGEHVYRVSALQSPPAATRLSAAKALTFPAIQLFVERASATMNGFELTDAEASLVSEICRKLDGIPLAIEFAVTRVETYGVRALADRLDDRLRLLTSGRRTALPRHQTMRAALDWSYDLLTETEQDVLRRVATFSGAFTMHTASTKIADAAQTESEVIDILTALVAKSMISADFNGPEPRLRLLETTRAYALSKLAEKRIPDDRN